MALVWSRRAPSPPERCSGGRGGEPAPGRRCGPGGGIPRSRSLALAAGVLPPSRWARLEWRENSDTEPRRPLGPAAPPYLGDQLEKHDVGGPAENAAAAAAGMSAAPRAWDQRPMASFAGSLEHRGDGIMGIFKGIVLNDPTCR